MSLPLKRRRGWTSLEKQNLRNGLLFVSPWILGFTVFLAYPIAMSIYYSLCDFSVLREPQFIGLANYQELFRDDVFLKALGNTFFYAAGAIPLGIILAFCIALLLNTGVGGMALYRTIYFLPSLVPTVALAILWMWIFNGKAGILNFALQSAADNLGWLLLAMVTLVLTVWSGIVLARGKKPLRQLPWAVAAVAGAGVLAATWQSGHTASLGSVPFKGPNWLSDIDLVKPALILMSLWGTGNAMVIYLAGLQDVPQHLLEAADLDGANWLQKIQHVTIPSVSPVILFNGIMAIIGTFNYFAIPYVMAPGGQPARSAYFLAVNLYDNAFQYLRMGYASAMAWVLFVIILILTSLAMKVSARHVHYGG